MGEGGTTFIHFIGVTSMAEPRALRAAAVPFVAQGAEGDVVFCELSACWWDYSGQVLRSFTVGAEPTPLYRDCTHRRGRVRRGDRGGAPRHDHGGDRRSGGVIEERGFTVCDDLMHGFGGGYFPPIVGTRSRPAGAAAAA